MRIILFTPPSDAKILAGEKTMTARFWLANPPKEGDIVAAQTGRAKTTRFALLKIVKVWEWSGTDRVATEKEKKMIAEKEGFWDFTQFYQAYYSLNAHNWNDPKRKHWFIEFEVKEICQPL